MEMNWVYLLIFVLYGLLLFNKVLYTKLGKEVKQSAGEHFSKQMVLKEDFFTTVAIICIIGTIIINVLCLIGGNGMNGSSIIVTLLVSGLALLSGLVPMLGTQNSFEIGDYSLSDERIKGIKSKKYGMYTRYQIVFEEEQNGYDSLAFFCMAKQNEILEKKLKKISTKGQS